jgi:hypothetical protein
MTRLAWLSLAIVLNLDGLAHANSGWRRIANEEGITVMERDVPGRGFPTFRGIGTVYASIYDVVAVISDIKRHTDWMQSILVSRELKRFTERKRIIYMRINSPWPVSDRDAVYRSETEVIRRDNEIDEVNVTFWSVKSKLKGYVDGVVRMEKLRGHYRFKALSANTTRVDYQVDADPGGWLPTWLAKLASRKLPLNTIRNMRKQVSRTSGWYAKRIKRWKEGE